MAFTTTTHPNLRCLLACLLLVAWNHRPRVVVDAANVFDWTPSISLSDNFGVAEGLCPDIAGFGASQNCDAIMQLHTCKRQGDDTQFVYDFTTKAIRSVNYDPSCQSTGGVSEDGACVTIDGAIAAGSNLRLDSCDGGMEQSFEVFVDGTIKSVSNPSLCLAKTSDVGPAGPNERTDFALAECDSADPLDVTWTIPLNLNATGEPNSSGGYGYFSPRGPSRRNRSRHGRTRRRTRGRYWQRHLRYEHR